jgi:hypothetical protein
LFIFYYLLLDYFAMNLKLFLKALKSSKTK